MVVYLYNENTGRNAEKWVEGGVGGAGRGGWEETGLIWSVLSKVILEYLGSL